MGNQQLDPRVPMATSNGSGVTTAVAQMRPLTPQEKTSMEKPEDTKVEIKDAAAVGTKVEAPVVKPNDVKPPVDTAVAPSDTVDGNEGDTAEATKVDEAANAKETYDWNKHATPEFFETGKLSPEALKEICDTFGIDKQAAEYTALGLAESVKRNTNEVLNAVGGKEVFAELSAWASKALTPESLKQFNADVRTGDVDQAKAAVVALKKQFIEINGSPKSEQQKLLQGTTNMASQGANTVQPFMSHEEFRGAQKDSRYRVDPVYTAEVHHRLLLAQRAGYFK